MTAVTGIRLNPRDVRQTLSALQAFKPAKQKTMIAKAVRAYSGIMRDGLKSSGAVPVVTGALRRSFGVVVRRYRNGSVLGKVGARKGFTLSAAINKRGKIVTGKKSVAKAGGATITRTPSRYSHIAEAHHGFHEKVAVSRRQLALNAFRDKLALEVDKEALKQQAKSRVK